MPPQHRDEFLRDHRLVQEAIQSGVIPSRSAKANHTWELWLDFCATHNIDPWFQSDSDPLPILQIFGHRYRDGRLSPSGKPVRHGTISDAMRMVGQSYRLLGAQDFRIDKFTGQLDFRLQRQLRSYAKQDPAPGRVKPIPIQVVKAILTAAYSHRKASAAAQATADMICIAFFFLLRPGEYTSQKDNNPFRLQDVQLFIGPRQLHIPTASALDLQQATSVSLTFTNQKNGVKGEVISHSRSGDPLVCPCLAVVRRVVHLIYHHQPPHTPLCTFFSRSTSKVVTTSDIRNTLRAEIAAMESELGIQSNEIDARSLRAGGATALLCAQIDPNAIQLLGRWKSDSMIRYLHIAANPHTQQYASQMLNQGLASFHPQVANTNISTEYFSPPQEEFL
jgi:integrase